ncbi:hypothetical protein chiPu_0005789 [Chiloscyllium punctatum]|uniref:Uncharacterized protein n=1 Tax=Chiloscyllium punctatum TaxID=137246 RepID=A0A401SAD5_CHIPU|nr:hypothetical protein [Chiloscyllium punctatum]
MSIKLWHAPGDIIQPQRARPCSRHSNHKSAPLKPSFEPQVRAPEAVIRIPPVRAPGAIIQTPLPSMSAPTAVIQTPVRTLCFVTCLCVMRLRAKPGVTCCRMRRWDGKWRLVPRLFRCRRDRGLERSGRGR